MNKIQKPIASQSMIITRYSHKKTSEGERLHFDNIISEIRDIQIEFYDDSVIFQLNQEVKGLNIPDGDYSFTISDDPYMEYAGDYTHLGYSRFRFLLKYAKKQDSEYIRLKVKKDDFNMTTLLPERLFYDVTTHIEFFKPSILTLMNMSVIKGDMDQGAILLETIQNPKDNKYTTVYRNISFLSFYQPDNIQVINVTDDRVKALEFHNKKWADLKKIQNEAK